ncbi:MAG: hypothetical protein WAO71_07425 [Gallionella sp.]
MQLNKFCLAGLLALGTTQVSQAHDNTPQPTAENPFLFMGGVGLYSLNASLPYPAARLPGILESGSARADERRSGMDYLEAGVVARLGEGVFGKLKVARHGGIAPVNEIDEVWLSADHPVGAAALQAKAGRQLVPMGLENMKHFHTRPFGIAPLALRAAINDMWRADGLQVNSEWGAYSVGAGVWSNSAFPGAPSSGINLATLRAGWQNPSVQLEAGYARASASAGRPLITTGVAGHTHAIPSCTAVTASRVCMVGNVDLLTLAGKWSINDAWTVSGEWWEKRDSGRLDSLLGTPDYVGKFNGGWIDVGWKPHAAWEIIARSERLIGTHTLVGANAALIATQAGIDNSTRPLTSNGLLLRWQPWAGHLVALEYHRESVLPQANTSTLLRYQYSFATSPARP